MIAAPRQVARRVTRAGTVISASMLALSLWTVWTAGHSPAGAAGNNGRATIVGTTAAHRPLTSGGSATPFTLKLGTNPVCPGDSASGNFRVQSFMIPASADINAMTFNANGPVAVDGQFRQPLFGADSGAYVDELTDVAVPPEVSGGISGLPGFDFRVFAPGDVPPGDYSIGIACTLGPAGPTQLKTFWSTTIAVTASAEDEPAGLTWTTSAPGGSLRGDSRNAPPRGDAATTTAPSRGDATTTTEAEAAAEDPTASTRAEVAFAGSDPSEPSMSSTVGELLTGTSPWHLVIWAFLLVIFGRMAVLLGRRPKVLPPSGD